MRANVIELNGRMYDAHSGSLLERATNKKVHASFHSNPHGHYHNHQSKPIDSIQAPTVRRQPASKTPVSVNHHQFSQPVVAVAAKTVPVRQAASPARRRPKPSTILHRTGLSVPLAQEIMPAVASPAVQAKFDRHRLHRAEAVTRSDSISRFAKFGQEISRSKLPAGDITKHLARTHHVSDIVESTQRPLKSPHSAHPVRSKTMQETKEALIKHRLDQAHSAKQHHKVATQHAHSSRKQRRAKTASLATGALAVIVLAGYVAYLNVPSISMKLATSQAGFAATMPGQTPSGYSLNGPIAAETGQVTINFASNTDDRGFAITQQPSTWDSQALLENYVSQKTAQHTTYQDRGLTVYVFEGDNAAWVNAGKLYKLDGKNSSLSSAQILSLATSM